MNDMTSLGEVRLDKWLWAARFFKTRHLAVEAINGGKVQVDGHRAKPGRVIRPGARLSIHKDALAWDLEVLAVQTQRRPAAEAALLYREDETSLHKRQEQVRQRREAGPIDQPGERPTKRDRRQIQRFTDHTVT
ncbi:MAG TPA: S4 domain-containing protein [Lamprocystis sp. (in: g-proteobacteria)]|nr:S4 domain-containing protein [Lamprocystis sp. (in: g-proteobacteria)]